MQKFAYHWRKAINIPAWVVQILVCIIYIGLSGWALAVVEANRDAVGGSVANALAAGAGVNIAIGLLTVVFAIIEIIFIAKGVMKPAVYLSFACVKTLIWFIMFILSCLSLAAASILLSLAAAATCLMQLIYGSIIVHRNRKGTLRGGKYDPAVTGHVEGHLYTPNTGSANPPQTQGYENYSTSIPAPANNYTQHGYGGGAAPYGQAGSTEYKSPVPSPAPQHQQGSYAPPNGSQGYYAPQQQQQQYYNGAPAPAGSYELGEQVRH